MFNRQSIHIAMLLWGCVFCLIAALCMHLSRNFDREKRRWLLLIQVTSAILLFADALAWGFRGSYAPGAYIIVRLSNFLVFVFSNLVLFFFHGYACCRLFPTAKERIHLVKNETVYSTQDIEKQNYDVPVRRIRLVHLLVALGVVLVIVSQFTHWYYWIDIHNIYHRNTGYYLAFAIPFAGMVIDLSCIIQYRSQITKEVFISVLLYLLLPFTATIVQTFYYGISLVNIAISISVLVMFIVAANEQNRILAEKEKEAAEMRISIMTSQIQPHFIYNSLNAIYYLCDKDTEQAKEAIIDFSDYLRHMLKAVNRQTPIPFCEELNHVKAYLKLEKMRFGEELNIIYKIGPTDFMVPALSVQPMVENAVKHGICQKEDGGTLTLLTQDQGDAIEVIVSDDGAGFDPTKKKNDGNLHIGIQNVKERLHAMCNGTLEIKSRSGAGTTVTIRLPKEKR